MKEQLIASDYSVGEDKTYKIYGKIQKNGIITITKIELTKGSGKHPTNNVF